MKIKTLFVKNKKGAALTYTMIFLMVLSVIVVSFSLISVNMYKSTAVSANKTQSFMFAKAIGKAFALELTEEVDANNIVLYLEKNTKYAKTVKGTASVTFDPDDENKRAEIEKAIRGTGLSVDDLAEVNLVADLKFYFKSECAYCGATLEDLVDKDGNDTEYCQSDLCKGKNHSEKNTNKRYLYLDVTVSYHGATEVVTTVFTYLDNVDFSDTMHDLFSVYNIYSTYPSEMTFDFAPSESIEGTQPNVYLYNGIDSESEGYGSSSSDSYKLTTNIKANLTSTGDVSITSSGSETRCILGSVTSYGSMTLSRVNVNEIYSRNALTIESTATVTGNIYSRGTVTVNGSVSNIGTQLVGGTIYALGDVTIRNCTVDKIIGGTGCNIILDNVVCTSISTGGSVTLKNSSVKENIYADGNVSITNSSTEETYINGKIETKGNVIIKNESTGTIKIGTASTGYVLHAGKNATFYNVSNKGNIIINGNVELEGAINYSASNNATVINGNLNVRGSIEATVGQEKYPVCYLSALTVNGDVLLSSGNKCIPLFGKDNADTDEAKTTISGILTTYSNVVLGDGVQNLLQIEKDNEGTDFDFGNSQDKFINLNGATIGTIYTQKAGSVNDVRQIFIHGGSITNGLDSEQIIISNITIGEKCSVNATGTNGCFIAVNSSELYGQIVTSAMFSLHSGSILHASANGFVHVSGSVQDITESGYGAVAYIDGTVEGELVVGSSVKGKLRIKSNAVLSGNDLDKAIYVNGDIVVDSHSAVAGGGQNPYAPRLITVNNNGNKIYVNGGNAILNGWVYDLYVKNGQIVMLEEISGSAGKPYIKGTTFEDNEYVFIGSDGLIDSEGATFTNENVIVYVYDTPDKPLGDLTISGTLIVRKGVTLKCKSLKVNNVITDYDGSTVNANNTEEMKVVLDSLVESFDFESSSVITKFEISGDTQINQSVNNKITVTDSTFGGWVKFTNVSGTVVFTDSTVSGTNHTVYPSDNSTDYKGCLDVGSANLDMVRSYVGGTATEDNTTGSVKYEGNVYVGGKFTMLNGEIYGTVYCDYADDLIDCKIDGGLIMTTETLKSATNWSPTYIDKVIDGKNVNVTVSGGILAGKVLASSTGEDNLESNAKYVRLSELKMQECAVVAPFVNIFIENGTDSAISGQNIGNVYAKTDKLTVFKANILTSVTISGYVNCNGTLVYSDNLSPTAEGGVFAKNTTTPLSATDKTFSYIKGNIDLPDYSESVALGDVSGYVYIPNGTVNVEGSIDGNVEVGSMRIESDLSIKFSGNVLSKGSIIALTRTSIDFYGYVKASLLVCNVVLSSGGDVTASTVINNSSNIKGYTDDTNKNIHFYSNVYVASSSSTGGRAFLRNCIFKGADKTYNGSTLYADRGVYATYSTFYGAGYQSTIKHSYSTQEGTYNTQNKEYSTKFGSVYAGLKKDESSNYGLYFDNVECYSNITLWTKQNAYISDSMLGEKYNFSSFTATNGTVFRNYTKYYNFGGSLELNNTGVASAISESNIELTAYTIINVGNALTLSGDSYIGSEFIKAREHAHTWFKGVYVGGNMTIGESAVVRLNIYCKGNLTNNGRIELNIKERIDWQDTTGWGLTGSRDDMYSTYTCGGIIQAKSYTNNYYCSLQTTTYGFSMSKSMGLQSFEPKNDAGHNTKSGVIDKGERDKDYTLCTHNLSNLSYGLSVSVASCSVNLTTNSSSLADALVKYGVSRDKLSAYLPTLTETVVGFDGLKWDSLSSMDIKRKTPLPSMAINTINKVTQLDELLVNKEALPLNRLNTDNWYPQAIPLKWVLPTETTAGDAVALNNNADNVLTVTEKKLGGSIDSLEACTEDIKRLNELDIWDWVSGEALSVGKSLYKNAQDFFTNLSSLNTPSSDYLGLKFASKEDAEYYRLSASNVSTVLSDLGSSDMLIITRRTFVVEKSFPSGNILENLINYVGWNENWVIPTSYSLNQRPVGLVFFNSGVVSESVFDETYRKADDMTKEKDDQGRWKWGNGGGNWTANLSVSNDVTWTFFTCEDPTDPYGSEAKDLHIVLPKSAKMVWEKDKDSCLNIIGNGRVFLYLQDDSDIIIKGNGFTNWLHDEYSDLDNWISQWTQPDATYNVFGGVRYVQTTGNGFDEKTYYDDSGNPVMDEKAKSSGQYQLQPRLFIVGTGGNISFEVQDFQTAAYVYMPSGYSYGDPDARNVFKVTANNNGEGNNHWDIYGMYVCDNFEMDNELSGKINYIKTVPDMSDTVFKYTDLKSGITTYAIGDNRLSYKLAEFWDYPEDIPVSSMNWYYRGIAIN